MKVIYSHIRVIPLMLSLLGLAACSPNENETQPQAKQHSISTPVTSNQASTIASDVALTVFKSPTCGCCKIWIDHLEQNGFVSDVDETSDLAATKSKLGIKPEYQSCHTAVSKEGYAFEGHIPAKFIRQFIKEKPADVIGLAVAGMPLGSPGMEVDDKFTPYQILQLNKDGSSQVYADVKTAAEQYE